MPKGLDYGNMMHAAMRGLIQQVLEQVGREGLPGEHHFFITFDTTHPGVGLNDWLRDRYPEEMTIVLQHWFDHLEVDDDAFSVTLNFGDQPESLTVPFDSIRTFVDPSVEFGLRFETQDVEDEEVEAEDAPASRARGDRGQDAAPLDGAHRDPNMSSTRDDAEPGVRQSRTPADGEAEIVSLDSFRK